MNKEPIDLLKKATIVNELGLHARAAAKIVNLAAKANQKIWIIKDNERIDASSIIDILTLGYTKGTLITLAAENKTDIDILNNIIILVENGFGE
ncbi:MAG: HPr family phosphocarrier protein [Desulfobacterium sp.]|nr:HPr family phosphocarrier protein [Desulfobacterium sp.]MBU3948223.1 HPr family phosphocarrier protein [Pseudomonadota bacterium]MBU4011303.1 HPr family phosphocarrier protein [Pseudomonadota bacterium]MBU4036236.1 HPr family phosphocarrier protein [Pseudomonadota bacterium]